MSTAVEATILIPLVMVVLALMTAGFRVWQGRTDLHHVAAAAARAASQARTATEADYRARRVVEANAPQCESIQVTTHLEDFALPPGQSGSVEVQLTCLVTLADLVVRGLPGRVTVTVSAVAPLDTYRTRRR